MAQALRDDRKNVLQAFMEVPGSRLDLTVTNADTPTVFQPDLLGEAHLYAVRTNAEINLAAHNASHVFDFIREPMLAAAEEKLFKLDPSRRDRITMRAVTTTATVTISEVDDE